MKCRRRTGTSSCIECRAPETGTVLLQYNYVGLHLVVVGHDVPLRCQTEVVVKRRVGRVVSLVAGLFVGDGWLRLFVPVVVMVGQVVV